MIGSRRLSTMRISSVNGRHWDNSTTNSNLKLLTFRTPQHRHNWRASLKPKNLPPSGPTMNWSKDGPRRLSCSLTADQHFQLSKSPTPLSKEILECEFPKKFSTPTYDYYSVVSDLVQHIRHFQDKMVIYSHNDPIMCLTFPSSLKGVASDWFYSMPPHFFHNFEEVFKAFLTSTQLAGRLRGTITILSPLRWDRAPQILHRLLPEIIGQCSQLRWGCLHSRSSAGCKFFIPRKSIFWSITSLHERDFIPS